MNTSSALTVSEHKPAELVRQSTDIASLCREIVLKSAITIQKRQYVRVEGWQSIATAHGCVASAKDVERIVGGYRAIGEIRNMATGQVIAVAEGFVGEDETTWFGGEKEVWNKYKKIWEKKIVPKRPDYAIRAMAQTRAISRACRSAFAHIVVLMDAGLSTTPAEEVPMDGFNDDHESSAEQEQDEIPMEHEREQQSEAAATIKDWREVRIHFGKNGPDKGTGAPGLKLGDLQPKQFTWYLEKMRERNNDPKPQYPMSKDDRKLLAALEMANLELHPKADEKSAHVSPDAKKEQPTPPEKSDKEHLRGLISFNATTEEAFVSAAHTKGLNSDIERIDQMTPDEVAICLKNFDKIIAAITK